MLIGAHALKHAIDNLGYYDLMNLCVTIMISYEDPFTKRETFSSERGPVSATHDGSSRGLYGMFVYKTFAS